MDSYNGTDRRQPLSGISKQTFMDNAKEAFGDKAAGFFGLWYDMQRCTDSKVELANQKINDIKNQCECRLKDCLNQFDSRYLKQFSIFNKSFPISTLGFLIIFGGFWLLVGLGILDITDVVDIKSIIKSILI